MIRNCAEHTKGVEAKGFGCARTIPDQEVNYFPSGPNREYAQALSSLIGWACGLGARKRKIIKKEKEFVILFIGRNPKDDTKCLRPNE